jgi:hypothetical protein
MRTVSAGTKAARASRTGSPPAPLAYSGRVPAPKTSPEWRPWALLAGTLVVGVLLTASRVRPLVVGGVALVLICVFVVVRMVVDRTRTRR